MNRARAGGVAVPKTVWLRGNADLDSVAELRFPVVFKPFLQDKGMERVIPKTLYLSSAEEARD